MTIALAASRRFSGARYMIAGELSRYSDWSQTLELPADGASVSITGHSVKITFRECESDTTAALTVTSADSQITISDANTLTISVTDDVMSALSLDRYVVDITSSNSGAIAHWAHGVVPVKQAPVTFG
jgi:hypothetical protein